MFLQHLIGLFTHPKEEWVEIRDSKCSIGNCYLEHALFMAAIPALSAFIGTAYVGWHVGFAEAEPVRLTTDSAAIMSVLSFFVMLVGIFCMGYMIHWMSRTYGEEQPLQRCVLFATYTASPLFVVGLMLLYPLLWLNLLLGLPALAYTVYLLYNGLPIVMETNEDRGFLFSSAVLMVGMVALVGILAVTAVVWSSGLGPAFI